MSARPELPPAYEPVFWEGGTTVLAEAVRRARSGAPEGTLVWGTRPDQGEGRLGQPWHPPREGLFCALVLEPDDPLPITAQVALVALAAAGVAIAERVPPMTDLRFGWPNDLLLDGGKAAVVSLRDTETIEEGDPRLVLGLNLNLAGAPDPEETGSASLAESPEAEMEAREILEAFARHFLAGINRWAEEGLAPVRRQWAHRSAAPGDELRIALPAETVAGRLVAWTRDGGLVIELDGGGIRTLSLPEAFDLGSTEEATG